MILNLDRIKKQVPVIENLKQWLVDVPKLHPDHPDYVKVWTNYTRYSIEGLWGNQSEGMRFMPGTLFFYGNFYTIHVPVKGKKNRKPVRPSIRDVNWMIHYAYMECQGFSGWDKDEEETSDFIMLDKQEYERLKKSNDEADIHRIAQTINSKGELKRFIHPREALLKCHDYDKGRPLFYNDASNLLIFGSRGGGKSYDIGGIAGHHLTFDGLKHFSDADLDNNKIEICVGSADTAKSSDFCSKIDIALKAFGTDQSIGVWGNPLKPDDTYYTPNPFYRDWIGTLNVGNKSNPFRYSYDIKVGNRWVENLGTQSALYHVNYSDKKQGGAEAAAGGRYSLCIYEEIGLMSNAKEAILSNIATVSDGAQFGVQIGIGTSGNIELVQQSKQIFNNPSEYNFLCFDNLWEEDDNKIGFFLPSYLVNNEYKDENGNTNFEAALEYYEKRRKLAAEKNDPEIYRFEQMNYPIVPSDMWVNTKGAYFPIQEAMDREKTLVHNNLYQTIGTSVKLTWDSSSPNGVKSEPDWEAEPFFEFPYNRTMTKLDGAIQIYKEPVYIKGEIPNDEVFFVLDPYVAENVDEGGSLGALYGFINPKYEAHGLNPYQMVCSYIGKHSQGKDAFYENVEKIIAYYGNPIRSLWYEANRGESVRGYFMRKKKLHLLCLRPQRETGSGAYEKRVQEYGVIMPDKITKLEWIGDTYELLVSKVTFDGEEKRYIETIPDIFVIRQMLAFDMKKHSNFDAVSAFIMMPFVTKELEHDRLQEVQKKIGHNPLAFLSVNPMVFNKLKIPKAKLFNEKYSTD